MKSVAIRILFCFFCFSTAAEATPVLTFLDGESTTDFANRTFGYNFFTGSNGLWVTSLGFWDAGENGLTEAHEVGIWTADGVSQLAVATVSAGTTAYLDSGFRFVAIAPTFLAENSEFLIGAYLGQNIDPVQRFATATTHADITFGQTRYTSFESPSLAAPIAAQSGLYDDGYFGPNMNGNVSASIPAPSSLAIMALGLLIYLKRWRTDADKHE